jgi:hypothetical protein
MLTTPSWPVAIRPLAAVDRVFGEPCQISDGSADAQSDAGVLFGLLLSDPLTLQLLPEPTATLSILANSVCLTR